MKTTVIRSRIVGACLATIVLTASGSLLAESVCTPTIGLCSVEPHRFGSLTFRAPRELFPDSAGASVNAMAPWFRETFVPFPVDQVCWVEAPVATPVRDDVAVARIESPGVVQNLRRTDQR